MSWRVVTHSCWWHVSSTRRDRRPRVYTACIHIRIKQNLYTSTSTNTSGMSQRIALRMCVAHYEKVVGIKMRSGGGSPGHSGMPRCVPTQPEKVGGYPKTYTIATAAAPELHRCVGKSTGAICTRHLKSGSGNRALQTAHSNDSNTSAQFENDVRSY